MLHKSSLTRTEWPGTFVYGEDGKTVVGVAKANYDADGDGVNDTVVLNNANGDFSSKMDDDIIVSGRWN